MIKFIDTLYYFYFKKEEKDFGRNIWSAIYAAFSFVGNLFCLFFILTAILINWDPYDYFWLTIPGIYVKILIAFPFVFWGAYFRLGKRYLRIIKRPEIYDTHKKKIYFKLWFWGTIILCPPAGFIGFAIKFGF